MAVSRNVTGTPPPGPTCDNLKQTMTIIMYCARAIDNSLGSLLIPITSHAVLATI